MLKQRKGFTLIELLAVIAILAIILIIAVPSVMKTINNSKMHAFESNAQFVIRAMELKATQNRSFDPTTITAENIKEILNLDNSNYESIIVTFQNKEIGITIVGKTNGKD